MFDWLFEGRTSVYAVLAALVVFLLLAWWQMRKRWLLAGVALTMALVGLYALLDKAVETDREQIVRRLKEMVAAVNAHNLEAAFVHISERFHSQGGKSKRELRELAQASLESRRVESVQVWDIVIEGRPSREQGEVHVFFSAKTHNAQEFLTDCDSVFEFDPQHGWQLRGFRLLKPQTNEDWNFQI
ncbi:MAG TPA: hypothetical protein VH592_02755 [Gemmataceae bacterium]